MISALGVREGLLYSLLDDGHARAGSAARPRRASSTSCARARPRHGEELLAWTDRFMATTGLDETAEEKRLRHAACLLADIGWRAHPDYRGEQSLNIIANAAFVGIDHHGRAYLALANYFRHVGLIDDELSPRLRELATTRILDRARILGAALRVAYSSRPRCPASCRERRCVSSRDADARSAEDLEALGGERVASACRRSASSIGREPEVRDRDAARTAE